jgi:hypothetical protein
MQEAERYALENCRITKTLPEYDPQYRDARTPEEYRSGDQESYTVNAHRCHCRHNCTNYDELIKTFDRDSLRDNVFYEAIRERIEELLNEVEEGELLEDNEGEAAED